MRYLFSVLFLALASCRYCGVDAPEDLRGAFADPERKIVIVITPEFLITAWEGRKASASDHKLSPLWGVKKYYHIVKDGNTLIIKAGPAWSDGGEALRVIGKDEYEAFRSYLSGRKRILLQLRISSALFHHGSRQLRHSCLCGKHLPRHPVSSAGLFSGGAVPLQEKFFPNGPCFRSGLLFGRGADRFFAVAFQELCVCLRIDAVRSRHRPVRFLRDPSCFAEK